MISKQYKWLVVLMLWFVCLFNYADRQAIFSVFPLLEAEMGLSKVQLGIVGSSFMWVYAVALPLAGLIGDRFSRKKLILGGLIFWSLVTLATAFSQNYWHLVFFRALEGFGEAFYFPASMSLISDYHGKDTRSRAMSFHQSSVYAGTILGGTAAGFMGEFYGWRSGFYLFGILGTLLGFVLLWTLKEPVRGQADGPAEPEDPHATRADAGEMRSYAREVTRLPMVLVLMAVFCGANFVATIFLTWMPTFLNEKFKMTLSMAGLNSTAWLQIASVLGVLTGGFLADRWVRRRSSGRMLVQGIGLLAGVPFIFLTGNTMLVPVLVAAMVGFGFFKGFYDANIWASLYDVVKPARRATALGLMNSIGWFAGSVGPVAVGAASAKWGMGACLSATSLVYLAFGALLLFGARAYMPKAAPAPG
ncbi:MAG: spinster family MFS transporter [Actinomycetota bacterium]